MRSFWLVAIASVALAGCAGVSLKPAPEASLLAQGAATASAEDVRMVARAEAWQGMPPRLDEAVTPMLVTVSNDGARPIRIDYDRMALVAPDGRRYRALHPHSIEGSVSVTMNELGYPPLGFVDPGWPYFGANVGGLPPHWMHRPYWHVPGSAWHYVRLPTVDMLRQALPEGVLQLGGVATGFVYFQRLSGDTERVELRAEFPSAAGEQVTRLEIPFVMG